MPIPLDDDLFLNITGHVRAVPPPVASRNERGERGGPQRHEQAGRGGGTTAARSSSSSAQPPVKQGDSRHARTSPSEGAAGKRPLGSSEERPKKKLKHSSYSTEPETQAPKCEPQGISQKFSVKKQDNKQGQAGQPVEKKMSRSKKAKLMERREGAATSTEVAEEMKAKLREKSKISVVSAPRGGIPSNADFKKLNLHESLGRQLEFLQFGQCTPIQALVVPAAMDGQRDVLVRAPTGSGKTLAFLLPILHQLLQLPPAARERSKGTLFMALSPTKELALQTLKVSQDLLRMVPSIVCGAVAGGEKPKSEKARLRKGLTVLCATPGRLAYHMENSGSFNVAGMRYMAFDEADRLLDLGFEPQIRRIYKMINEARSNHAMAMETIGRKTENIVLQNMLVSATLTPAVTRLANFCLRKNAFWADPDASAEDGQAAGEALQEGEMSFSIPSTLTQWYCVVPCKERLVALISAIISRCSSGDAVKKAIVFFSANSSVDFHNDIFKDIDWPSIHGFAKPKSESERKLRKDKDGFVGYDDQEEEEEEQSNEDDAEEEEEEEEEWGEDATAEGKASAKIFSKTPLFKLHGDLDKEERAGYIRDFSKAAGGVLLASDAASRGLDFPRIDWIIQYDPPTRVEEYLHRIGRTARIGRSGDAMLFLQPSEKGFLDVLGSHGVKNLKEIRPDALIAALLRSGAPEELSRTRDFSARLNAHLASHVGSIDPLLKLARTAFLATLRSYRSFPLELRHAFPFNQLHTGHFASSFALREAPQQASRRSQKGGGKGKGKGDSSEASAPGRRKFRGMGGAQGEFSA